MYSHSFGCSLVCDRLRGWGCNRNTRADRNARANINVSPDTHPNASSSRILAHRELANDKIGRRKLYEALGMELDDTVL